MNIFKKGFKRVTDQSLQIPIVCSYRSDVRCLERITYFHYKYNIEQYEETAYF